MNIERLHRIKEMNVLIFGDFMVDKYIVGNVKRISPEAPVPILEVKSKTSKLGGAGNVVNNIIALGGKTKVVGCVGDDADGEWIRNELIGRNVDVTYLSKNSKVQTIVKTRLVSKNQQFLRCDEEIIQDIPNEYADDIKTKMDKVFEGIQVLILSDYGKGAITKQLAQMFIQKANELGIPTVVDPKGTDYSKYTGATVCTPNTNELSVVTGKSVETEEAIVEAGSVLCERVQLQHLMLTRSEKGISIFTSGQASKKDFPAVAKDVIDVCGAGDTVVSVVALCLGIGLPIDECAVLANLAASVVCSKFGAATLSLNELIECVLDSGEFKLVDIETAKYLVQSLKEKGKRVVFTNGCFDLLHAGHVSSFFQAKSFGDVLIVAVNSDASVKRLKGDLRPVVDQDNRIKMLCALECIDYVILMEDDTPVSILETVKPDFTVKGKDWEGKDIPEKAVVEAYGGEMKFIELEAGLSTTNIIDKIVKAY